MLNHENQSFLVKLKYFNQIGSLNPAVDLDTLHESDFPDNKDIDEEEVNGKGRAKEEAEA